MATNPSRHAFPERRSTDDVPHARLFRARCSITLQIAAWLLLHLIDPIARAPGATPNAENIDSLLAHSCLECHSSEHAEAGVNLELSRERDSFVVHFRMWENAIAQLEQGTMPPPDAAQLDASQRQRLLIAIREKLRQAALEHAGEPGPVVIRRLTSAEYGYTIRDLTGLDIDVSRNFVSDAVGGAGFTNTGIVQFVQDATLQRYLDAARQTAAHAVIGTGPLMFFRDPGQTGLELSAITRIQQIYRTHGFRTAAGEGGEAFGLEKYPRAFYAAWLYEHRDRLGLGEDSLDGIAATVGVEARFVQYIHELATHGDRLFPTSTIVSRWRELPAPDGRRPQLLGQVRQQCDEIAAVMHDWQLRFGTNADAKEDAPVLRQDLFNVTPQLAFTMNVNWPPETTHAHLVLSLESAIGEEPPDAVVAWRDPRIQFRIDDQPLPDPSPLHEHLAPATATQLGFGTHPRGGTAGPDDFVTVGGAPVSIEIPIPPGARSAGLTVTAELDSAQGENRMVRCTIAQLEETDQGTSVSGLLANPGSPDFETWKAGVLEFARLLPQLSHHEPTPSDRDPIPPPLDPSYNNPERNAFHARIKYSRDDAFLVDHILDDRTRQQLDRAWTDLLGSFDYHDLWLRTIAEKFTIDLAGQRMADIDEAWITGLPPEARIYVEPLHRQFRSTRAAFERAEPGHVQDVVRLAGRAWRRPVSSEEEDQLCSYYRRLREEEQLEHRAAVCALISRVLVSPYFLYRVETDGAGESVSPLSDWELASRLSYFLWSSLPDDELRRVAAAGELNDADQLRRQVRRMLSDPKARRLAAEFFGQWFGIYRFDQYRGIDAQRFPEFSDSLKASLYGEAVEFFHHVVRHDRPLDEILFADYTFLNGELTRHYGMEPGMGNSSAFRKVEHVQSFHRGGLLRLGAVLAATSAPLRTSPVKRGDWILRRVLGTPVPPPPADAGSIAPDEQHADGRTVREQLEMHRRDASCINCHARIDALGFALERYDPLGRRRDHDHDGRPIDVTGKLRDGTVISGDAGLLEYLSSQKDRFHQNLCRKLLGFALGRQERVGDLPLLEEMSAHLRDGGGMSGLVERIVGSRQFRYHGTIEPDVSQQASPASKDRGGD